MLFITQRRVPHSQRLARAADLSTQAAIIVTSESQNKTHTRCTLMQIKVFGNSRSVRNYILNQHQWNNLLNLVQERNDKKLINPSLKAKRPNTVQAVKHLYAQLAARGNGFQSISTCFVGIPSDRILFPSERGDKTSFFQYMNPWSLTAYSVSKIGAWISGGVGDVRQSQHRP